MTKKWVSVRQSPSPEVLMGFRQPKLKIDQNLLIGTMLLNNRSYTSQKLNGFGRLSSILLVGRTSLN